MIFLRPEKFCTVLQMPILKNKDNDEEKTYHFSFFLLSDSLKDLLLHTRTMTPADLITKRRIAI